MAYIVTMHPTREVRNEISNSLVPVAKTRLSSVKTTMRSRSMTMPIITPERFIDAHEAIYTHFMHAKRDSGGHPERFSQAIEMALGMIAPLFDATAARCRMHVGEKFVWDYQYGAPSTTLADALATLADQAANNGEIMHVHQGRSRRWVTSVPLMEDGMFAGTLTLAHTRPLATIELRYVRMLALLFYRAALAMHYHTEQDEKVRYWRRTFDALPDGVVIYSAQHTVLYCNSMALKFAANCCEIRETKERHLTSPEPIWRTSLPGGRPLEESEYPSIRAITNGGQALGIELDVQVDPSCFPRRTVPIRATATVLRNDDDETTHVVVIFQDITTTRDVEEMKEAFKRYVYHGVNNALTPLRNIPSLIKSNIKSLNKKLGVLGIPSEVVESFAASSEKIANRFIDGSALHIHGLVKELRDMDRSVLDPPAPMSFYQHVETLIPTYRSIHGHHRLRMEGSLATDTVLEGLWRQHDIDIIVTNLIENAFKYSPPETTVIVRLRPNRERFGSLEEPIEKPSVHLEVEDRGVGIPQKELETIFREFYRSQNADLDHELVKGEGIGLHLCWKAVQYYGGRIWAESEGLGKGSVFHVVLPLIEID